MRWKESPNVWEKPNSSTSYTDDIWAAVPQTAWCKTCATPQLWMQIVGKVRLALKPTANYTWNVTHAPERSSYSHPSTSMMLLRSTSR